MCRLDHNFNIMSYTTQLTELLEHTFTAPPYRLQAQHLISDANNSQISTLRPPNRFNKEDNLYTYGVNRGTTDLGSALFQEGFQKPVIISYKRTYLVQTC